MKKRLFILSALMLLSLSAWSQSLVSAFLKDSGEELLKSAMQVNISGKILRLAAAADSNIDLETKKLFESIDRINAVVGLSVDNNRRNQLEAQLAPFEELLSVVEEGRSIRMYTRETKGQIEEFVLYVIEGNEMTLMSIVGKIDLKRIAGLAGNLQIDGMEHLDKIK